MDYRQRRVGNLVFTPNPIQLYSSAIWINWQTSSLSIIYIKRDRPPTLDVVAIPLFVQIVSGLARLLKIHGPGNEPSVINLICTPQLNNCDCGTAPNPISVFSRDSICGVPSMVATQWATVGHGQMPPIVVIIIHSGQSNMDRFLFREHTKIDRSKFIFTSSNWPGDKLLPKVFPRFNPCRNDLLRLDKVSIWPCV